MIFPSSDLPLFARCQKKKSCKWICVLKVFLYIAKTDTMLKTEEKKWEEFLFIFFSIEKIFIIQWGNGKKARNSE